MLEKHEGGVTVCVRECVRMRESARAYADAAEDTKLLLAHDAPVPDPEEHYYAKHEAHYATKNKVGLQWDSRFRSTVVTWAQTRT